MHKHAALLIPALLIFYNFCANLSNDIYLPSLPSLVTLLHATPALIQLSMTIWFAGVALPQLFFGPLSDRYGRKPILMGGGVCFLFGTLICATAFHSTQLLIGRFLQGIGVCTLNVASYAILIDFYDYQTRTRIMNKLSFFGTLAPLIGPILGGYIFIYFGWRANFLLIAVMIVASLVGLGKVLPETNHNVNIESLKWQKLSKNYLSMLRNKNFILPIFSYCLLLGGMVAYLTAAPFIIIHHLSIPTTHFGYTQLPIFMLYIVGGLYLNFYLDKIKISSFIATGLKLIKLSSLLMLLGSLFLKDSLLLLILPMMLYVLGLSLCASPLVSEGMASIQEHKGLASALLGFAMATSCMVMTFLLQMIYNGSILSLAIFLFCLTTIVSLVYAYAVQRTQVPVLAKEEVS